MNAVCAIAKAGQGLPMTGLQGPLGGPKQPSTAHPVLQHTFVEYLCCPQQVQDAEDTEVGGGWWGYKWGQHVDAMWPGIC